MAGVKNKAAILAFIGASGSGKSTAIKRHLKTRKPPRLLVWDPMKEYGEFGQVVQTLSDAFALVYDDNAQARRRFSVVVQPLTVDKRRAPASFSAFCRMAHIAGGCTVVVEELALVTSPSYAPPGWQAVNLTGRHKGLTVLAASQRPASVDKDFWGNATVIRCGRLNYKKDVATMADILGVSQFAVLHLQPLEYIERDMQTGKTSRGKMKI